MSGRGVDLSELAATARAKAQGQGGEPGVLGAGSAVTGAAPGGAGAGTAQNRAGSSDEAGRIPAPLEVELTPANLAEMVELSAQVPVVVAITARTDPGAARNVSVLGELCKEADGAFQLAVADVETNPQVAQAFGVTSYPYTLAVLGGRPVPLYEGVAEYEQLRALLEQLIALATQQGITGKVTGAPPPKPVPPLHLEAQAAIEAGDLGKAIKCYEKALLENPRDHEAQAALSQVRLMQRLEESSHQDTAQVLEDPLARADQLLAAGHAAAALDLLLDRVAASSEEDKEAARARLVEMFHALGATPEVSAARRRLASLIM
ncbi:tetratricopeptide repeat protein [Buchananella felis]|uniref:tetratricopeptide repeat protein n=1 Tax=Buchananella felis TaxID=3231492 RepID=UPI003527F697